MVCMSSCHLSQNVLILYILRTQNLYNMINILIDDNHCEYVEIIWSFDVSYQRHLHNLATTSNPHPYHNAFKACALQLPHASSIYPLFLANLLLTDPPTATGFVAALTADPLQLNPLKILVC